MYLAQTPTGRSRGTRPGDCGGQEVDLRSANYIFKNAVISMWMSGGAVMFKKNICFIFK
jgi:hypothetical protein